METEHLDRQTIQRINQDGWNRVAPSFYGITRLPLYGPLAPTEDQLQLLDAIQGARVLEMGCGSGHSLLYLGERGAADLWGLDLSPVQIEFASALLQERGYHVHLLQSPMEENPGLPEAYFDLVFSIYALGWTFDLTRTLTLISSYLKPGGSFIFSWEHPVFSCLYNRNDQMVLGRSYSEEKPVVKPTWADGAPIVGHQRKLSTFINGLIDAGLIVERVVEGDANPSIAETGYTDSWYSLQRAQMMPTTCIVKARKPL